MINPISFLKLNYKKIFYGIIITVAIYFFIQICTPKPHIPKELKNKIDSLTNANLIIQQRQKSLDSAIGQYESKIEKVDFQLNNIKEKTTIVREYYHEVTQQAAQYTPTQVDSFFKARYKY